VRKLLTVSVAACAALLIATPAGAGGDGEDEEDEAIAEEALPTLDDLPAGWEEGPDDDTERSNLDECEAIDAATKSGGKQPNAESPNFVDGANATAQVEARIFVFPNAKGAKKYFKAWNAAAAEDCLVALGLEAVPDADVSVETLGLEGIGDDVVGRSLIVEADEGTVYLDFLIARVGRGIVGLATQDLGGSLPEGLDLLELTADRLEEGL
jgi:hypothetical protein